MGKSFITLLAVSLLAQWPLGASAAEYGATYAPSAIGEVRAGDRLTVSVKITNTGTLTWHKASPYHTTLGHRWHPKGSPAALLEFSSTGPALTKPVGPGESLTMSAETTAPSVAGEYVLKWDLYQVDTIKWFSSRGVPNGTLQVVTKDGRASNLFVASFTARRDWIKLPRKDVDGDCSRTAWADHCQGTGTRAKVLCGTLMKFGLGESPDPPTIDVEQGDSERGGRSEGTVDDGPAGRAGRDRQASRRAASSAGAAAPLSRPRRRRITRDD